MKRAAQTSIDPRTVLKERFGLTEFRPGQEECIQALLQGRDVVGVLPTGAGKSLVYQLASQLLPGVTIVVSPLIALMQDQVDSLEERGLDVGVVNSTQSEDEIAEELDEVKSGEAKLLYVTPERFDNADALAELKRLEVSLFVIDEAHSISDWGHDFRPAYLTLGEHAQALGRPPILALTATATPIVRQEIIERLGLRDPLLVVRGTDRPNLFLDVRRVESPAQKWRELERLFEEDDGQSQDADLTQCMKGSGIVYTATTRSAQRIAEWLSERGVRADYYHGQRRSADRERAQAAFMSGEIQVMAATNAFGLGVDKPDVRFVIHFDVPSSLEAYYQEAGRAGRDGETARCLLIARDTDLRRAAFLGASGRLQVDDLARARDVLVRQRSLTRTDLQRQSGLSRADLFRVLDTLEEAGVIRMRRTRVEMVADDFDPAAVPVDREDRRRAYERSRIEMLRAYVELRECRRRFILNYFGEEYSGIRCGFCDVDRAAPVPLLIPVDSPVRRASDFAVGEQVEHRALGPGTVSRVSGDTITVLFESEGYKTFDAVLIREKGILERSTNTPAAAVGGA